MTTDEPITFYREFLTERHQAFREQLESLLTSLVGIDERTKLQSAGSALERLDALQLALPSGRRPDWVAPLRKSLSRYCVRNGQTEDGQALIKSILVHYRSVAEQRWSLEPHSLSDGLDFEALFQQCYRDSRVPELFESLANSVEQAAASGEIDSLRVLKALERTSHVIRRNLRGSYLSSHGAWYVARRLLDNIILEGLSGIPALGVVVRAIKATSEEIEKEMQEVDDAWREQINLGEAGRQLYGSAATPKTLGGNVAPALPAGGLTEPGD